MAIITTIKVYQKTKVNLERFKEHRKESYDELIKKLLYILKLVEKNPELGKKLLKEIEAAKRRGMERKKMYEHPMTTKS